MHLATGSSWVTPSSKWNKPRSHWTLGHLMSLVAVVAISLGLLRSELGEIWALIAAGIIGCGLAPWLALRGMREIEREQPTKITNHQGARPNPTMPRVSHLAQAFLWIWTAWFSAGVVLGILGVVAARALRPS